MREFIPEQGGSPIKYISLMLILIVSYLGNTSSKPFLLPFPPPPRDCLKNFLRPLITYSSYYYYYDIHLSVLEPALILCPILNDQQLTQVILITSL